MKPKDLREKTVEELGTQLTELKEDLFRLKFKQAMGQLEQKSNLRRSRRNIARIHTILGERARLGETKKVKSKSVRKNYVGT